MVHSSEDIICFLSFLKSILLNRAIVIEQLLLVHWYFLSLVYFEC
jgi:hypothetical protein